MKKISVTTRGWPWQELGNGKTYGWNPLSVKGYGRFGGGWAIKFGITLSRKLDDIIFDLGLGSIRVQIK